MKSGGEAGADPGIPQMHLVPLAAGAYPAHHWGPQVGGWLDQRSWVGDHDSGEVMDVSGSHSRGETCFKIFINALPGIIYA